MKEMALLKRRREVQYLPLNLTDPAVTLQILVYTVIHIQGSSLIKQRRRGFFYISIMNYKVFFGLFLFKAENYIF